jgi:hypothetical protein
MCEKCAELDIAIERYKRVIALIQDSLTVSEAKKMLSEAMAQKIELHPDN